MQLQKSGSLTHAEAAEIKASIEAEALAAAGMLTYADVCWRMQLLQARPNLLPL